MGAVATEDGVDVSQHLGVFAGARMPTPEILPGHKMWAATRPPTAKTTHPLLHTQDLLKGMTAAHQEGLPKETNFREDYPDRGSALHLNKIRGRIYTPAGLPADSAFGPAVT